MESQYLKKIPLFEGISEEILHKMELSLGTEEFGKDQVVFKEGEMGDRFYIIEEGKILVYKQIEDDEKTLATMESGDFFGDMAILEDAPRSASIKTTEPSRLKVFRQADFNRVLEEDKDSASRILFNMIKILSGRLRTSAIEMTVLFETGKLVGSSGDFLKTLNDILGMLQRNIESDIAMALLYNELNDLIEIKAVNGVKPEHADVPFGEVTGSLRKIMEGGDRLMIPFEEEKKHLEKFLGEREAKWCLLTPLKTPERTIGTFLFIRIKDTPFAAGQINLVAAVANQISVAVANLRAREENELRLRLKRMRFV